MPTSLTRLEAMHEWEPWRLLEEDSDEALEVIVGTPSLIVASGCMFQISLQL